MNCGRVSNQLSAYLDRELTGIEMLQIRSHLTACDWCRSEHEGLCRLKLMLGRLQSQEPPRGFVGDTVQRFELSGVRPSSTALWGRGTSRFSAIVRLVQALEGERAPLPSVGGLIGPPLVVQRLLSLIPWRPLTM